jgi:hypothetical protein
LNNFFDKKNWFYNTTTLHLIDFTTYLISNLYNFFKYIDENYIIYIEFIYECSLGDISEFDPDNYIDALMKEIDYIRLYEKFERLLNEGALDVWECTSSKIEVYPTYIDDYFIENSKKLYFSEICLTLHNLDKESMHNFILVDITLQNNYEMLC